MLKIYQVGTGCLGTSCPRTVDGSDKKNCCYPNVKNLQNSIAVRRSSYKYGMFTGQNYFTVRSSYLTP